MLRVEVHFFTQTAAHPRAKQRTALGSLPIPKQFLSVHHLTIRRGGICALLGAL
jgi:hypothetical protein